MSSSGRTLVHEQLLRRSRPSAPRAAPDSARGEASGEAPSAPSKPAYPHKDLVDEWAKGRSRNGSVKWADADVVDDLLRRRAGSTYVFAPMSWKRENYTPNAWARICSWFDVDGEEGPSASLDLLVLAVAANPYAGLPETRGRVRLT